MADDNDAKSAQRTGNSFTWGIVFGMMLGSVLGQLVFDNIALGIGVGVALGIAMGSVVQSQRGTRAHSSGDGSGPEHP
jgi:hypothetical protein